MKGKTSLRYAVRLGLATPNEIGFEIGALRSGNAGVASYSTIASPTDEKKAETSQLRTRLEDLEKSLVKDA